MFIHIDVFDRWVITAGHCVHNTPLERMRIRLGEWNVRAQNERLPHEDYRLEAKVNTIAYLINGNSPSNNWCQKWLQIFLILNISIPVCPSRLQSCKLSE